MTIQPEMTPNPNTIKFNVGRSLLESGTVNYENAASAAGSKVASALFALRGVSAVMIGRDFVTVTKKQSIVWADLAQSAIEAIDGALSAEGPAGPESVKDGAAVENKDESETVKRIRKILDEEIRPAVNMDGGDIVFRGYENGVVKLSLRGACSFCPSANMTLKLGVENRLKSLIPEVREVVQV